MTIRYDLYLDKVPAIILPTKTIRRWRLQRIRNSLMETSMVEIFIHHSQKVKMVGSTCRCCFAVTARWYRWASGNHYDRWEWCWHHYGLDQANATVKKFSSDRLCISEKRPIKISKGWFWKWPRDFWCRQTKKKKQALLVKRHGMIMITKMASVHQKSQSISNQNVKKSLLKKWNQMQQELGLIILIISMWSMINNIVPTLFQKEAVESYGNSNEGSNITPTLGLKLLNSSNESLEAMTTRWRSSWQVFCSSPCGWSRSSWQSSVKQLIGRQSLPIFKNNL